MNDMTTDTKEETGLVVMTQATALEALFRTPKGLDAIIGEIEKRTRATRIDVTTKKGRDECKSLAFKVAQSKTALDRAGKALNADMNAAIKVVNAERNSAWERLEKLQDEVRKPLDEWEAAEAKRVETLKLRLTDFSTSGISAEMSTAMLAEIIAKISGVEIGENWDEFEDQAIEAKAAALERCNAYLGVAKRREELAAENERLRAEAAERDRVEADRLAKEAADREREALERAEAEAAVAAQLKAQQDKIDQLNAEAQAREDADRLAAQAAERRKDLADRLIESFKQAALGFIGGKPYPLPVLFHDLEVRCLSDIEATGEHQDRVHLARITALNELKEIAAAAAAQQQAEKEEADRVAAEAAAKAQADEIEAARVQAASDERERHEAEQREAAEALEKRKADEAHKERIHAEIVEDLTAMAGRATPAAIATALMQNMIRHVTVTI